MNSCKLLCATGVYLTVTMAMTSLSVVFAVFVLHIHHRGSQDVRAPRWLRHFALEVVARALCMTVANEDYFEKRHSCFDQPASSTPEVCMNGMNHHHQSFATTLCGIKHDRVAESFDSRSNRNSNVEQTVFSITTPSPCNHYQTQTLSSNHTRSSFKRRDDVIPQETSTNACLQHELLHQLQESARRRDDDERSARIQREWHDVSAVCDRLLFVIFAAVTACSTVVLLFIYPMTKDVTLEDHIAQASHRS